MAHQTRLSKMMDWIRGIFSIGGPVVVSRNHQFGRQEPEVLTTVIDLVLIKEGRHNFIALESEESMDDCCDIAYSLAQYGVTAAGNWRVPDGLSVFYCAGKSLLAENKRVGLKRKRRSQLGELRQIPGQSPETTAHMNEQWRRYIPKKPSPLRVGSTLSGK